MCEILRIFRCVKCFIENDVSFFFSDDNVWVKVAGEDEKCEKFRSTRFALVKRDRARVKKCWKAVWKTPKIASLQPLYVHKERKERFSSIYLWAAIDTSTPSCLYLPHPMSLNFKDLAPFRLFAENYIQIPVNLSLSFVIENGKKTFFTFRDFCLEQRETKGWKKERRTAEKSPQIATDTRNLLIFFEVS